MKYSYIAGLLCFLSSTFVFAADQGYKIKVKINGLKDTTVLLGNHFADKQYVIDTVRCDSKGNLVFEGKEKLKPGIYLTVLPSKRYFEFLITSEQEFSLETDTGNFVYSMKVKGSNENQLFYDYLKFIEAKGKLITRLREKIDDKKAPKDSIENAKKQAAETDNEVKNYKKNFINQHPKSFLTTIFKASQDPEIPEIPLLPNGRKDSVFQYNYYKQHFFDGLDFSNEGLLRTPVFHARLKTYLDNLTFQIPDSISKSCIEICERAKANKEVFKYCVVEFTSTYEKSNIMGFEAVFVDMVDKYYRTGQAVWADSVTLFKIKDKAGKLKPLLIGKKAPNLTLKDTSGVYQTLYNFRNDFVVLAFWDPDCSHCKKEIPVLLKEYNEKLKKRNLEVFAVCTEAERNKWTDFIRKEKLNWVNVADIELQNPFRTLYDIHSTPVIYVLDKNKMILAKRIPVEKIDEFLERHITLESRKKTK
jgi:peroxiredoxin